MYDEVLNRDVLVQIAIASSVMGVILGGFTLFVSYRFRRGRPLAPRLTFILSSAIGFFGMVGAMWGPLDLWVALIAAVIVGPMAGAIGSYFSRPDILAITTGHPGSPTN